MNLSIISRMTVNSLLYTTRAMFKAVLYTCDFHTVVGIPSVGDPNVEFVGLNVHNCRIQTCTLCHIL